MVAEQAASAEASSSSQHYDAELDIDYSEIYEQYALDPESGFDNVLVVDNLPIVDESRRQKLLERLRQTFAKAGAPLEGSADDKGGYDDMDMPWDDAANSNKGYMFITYPNAALAAHALRALDHLAFGKNRLLVNKFGEIERYASLNVQEGSTPRGWVEDSEAPEQEHLKSWLADAQGRDQYVTFRDQFVDVAWCGRNGSVEAAVKSEPRWGELFVSWSPKGTYFTTLHRIGVALWSGKSFKNSKNQRFTHPGVKLIDFSPCEQYLVTWSPDPIVPTGGEDAAPDPRNFGPEDEGNMIAVWEVKTGLLLRTFPGEAPPPPPPAGVRPEDVPAPRRLAWPLLRWSPDDKYVARCNLGQSISIYELPSMGMLDKRSVKVEGVLDFEWCPDAALGGTEGKENVLAFWQPEVENQPAKISLMGVPSRQVLRSKNIFNVADCKLHWQDQGAFLCVKVDRLTKTKKAIYSNLELFRMREKNYPVEVIELKDVTTTFAWEPTGSRFCALTSPDMGAAVAAGVTPKVNADFYHIDPKKGDFRLMRRLENKNVNHVAWSPKGRFVVLATLASSAKSDIEFWDLDFQIDDTAARAANAADSGASIQLLGSADHYGVTDISWDPSGRYVASIASAWKSSPEPGYILFDFRGQELTKVPLEKFKQFVWRPRPPTLLAKEDIKRVRKQLREFSKQFDEDDAAEESNVSAELIAMRQRLVSEWNAWRAKRVRELAEERKREGKVVDTKKQQRDEQQEQIEEWVEEVLEETEEVVVG